ncbi:MAG: hypothetical protein GY720_23860 [bacterium]|nr:hypothetical protein [bacterium]
MNIETAAIELKAEREKLVHQLTEMGADEKGELTGAVDYGEGFADAAAATAERSEVLGLVENLMTMLNDVDAALIKVADGTYGTCRACDKQIGADRLEFRPTSTRCIDCKALSE